ncbi:hypothetical protein SLS58_003081 [Diplodia intermedia]|uniref:Uncharacterized protein n=1 Tax=Diplodia intermedia TaxID=856260 RepID=A0ABR3TXT0_9PEZI
MLLGYIASYFFLDGGTYGVDGEDGDGRDLLPEYLEDARVEWMVSEERGGRRGHGMGEKDVELREGTSIKNSKKFIYDFSER